LLAIVTITDASRAVSVARALLDGGLPLAEVTLRTPTALDSIQRIADEVPELHLGAGTVLTPAQVREAKSAGARFIITPGFNPRVVDACREEGLPIYPGVATPTEIEAALEMDVRILKLFPAESMGGIAYLKAISGPYAGTGVSFVPTGGVTLENLAAYLKLPSVIACAGSWLAPTGWIESGAYDRIQEETRRAVTQAAADSSPT
jgi:2-dehydro-3-deoxyphosphogluconate aldolase/(4S)-4-hydroxy-2-oxoglutarate aldolase